MKIKVVWVDGIKNKAIFGILNSIDGDFLNITQEDGSVTYIRLKFIVNVNEYRLGNGK